MRVDITLKPHGGGTFARLLCARLPAPWISVESAPRKTEDAAKLQHTDVFGCDQEQGPERPSHSADSRRTQLPGPRDLPAFLQMTSTDDRDPENDSVLPPEARRSPPNPKDTRVSKSALVWVENLPPQAIPFHLCEHFPRIVNRLALCWADKDLAIRRLDDLLKDKRGGRQGFPADALREITTLREIAASGRNAALQLSP